MHGQSILRDDVPWLSREHFQHLHEGSGISGEVILERGYRTIQTMGEPKKLGFSRAQCRVLGEHAITSGDDEDSGPGDSINGGQTNG